MVTMVAVGARVGGQRSKTPTR